MKIFIINLPSDGNRREFMSLQCQKLGLEYEFIEAVRGKELKDDEIKAFYKYDKSIFKKQLSLGEIGCALSHRKAWTRILDLKLENAIILEDDCVLDERILDFIKNVNALPKFTQSVLLGHYKQVYLDDKFRIESPYSFWFKEKISNFYLYRLVSGGYGTHGYFITNNGAKKMLNATKSISKPIDHYTWGAYTNSLAIIPPILLPDEHVINSNLEMSSSIQNNENRMKKRPKWRKYFKAFKVFCQYLPLRILPVKPFKEVKSAL